MTQDMDFFLPVLLGSRGDQEESDLQYTEPEPPSAAPRWWQETKNRDPA